MRRLLRALALAAAVFLGGGVALFYYSLGFECWDVCPPTTRGCAWCTSRRSCCLDCRSRSASGSRARAIWPCAGAGGRWAAGPLGLSLLIPRALIAAALPVLQLTAGHAPRAPAGIADGLLLWSALVWLVGMIVLRRTLARPIVAAADAAR